MPRILLTSLDLSQNELRNAAIQNLASDPSSPVRGQVWFNTTSKLMKQFDGTIVQTVLYGGTQTTATNLAGGVGGSIPYQSGAGATAFLAPNTTTAQQVVVSTGTGSAGQAPTLTNAPAIAATNIPVASFPTLNQNTTGTAAGLSVTLPVAQGGTGATTAAGARAALGTVGKFAQTFGDGSATSYTITHNLGTQDIVTSVYLVASPNQFVECEVQNTSATTSTVLLGSAPASGSLRFVAIG